MAGNKCALALRRNMAAYDTVAPKCCLTVTQAFVCSHAYSETDWREESAPTACYCNYSLIKPLPLQWLANHSGAIAPVAGLSDSSCRRSKQIFFNKIFSLIHLISCNFTLTVCIIMQVLYFPGAPLTGANRQISPFSSEDGRRQPDFAETAAHLLVL